MTGIRESAWALLSKPMLVANILLVTSSAAAFRWIEPQLPAQIYMSLDVHGQPAGPGSAEDLWLMGAIMTVALALPLIASLAAAAGALDPTRRAECKPLLVVYRRHTVRLVEALTLGANLTIGSAWLGFSVGQLPAYARTLPLQTMLPLCLGIMALAIAVPFLFVLPAQLHVTQALQAAAARERGPTWGPAPARTRNSAAAGPPRTQQLPRLTGWSRSRAPLLLALVLLPSFVLALRVWLRP